MSIESRRLAGQSRLQLARASTHFERGEIGECADAVWSAATCMVAAAAVTRGWEHDDLREIFDVAYRLDEEAGDDALSDLLGRAYLLYWHSDDGHLTPFMLDYNFRGATEFVQKMRALIEDE